MIGFKLVALREENLYSSIPFYMLKSNLDSKKSEDDASYKQGDLGELPLHSPLGLK